MYVGALTAIMRNRVLLWPECVSEARNPLIHAPNRPALECGPQADVAQLVEHFTRNEGVRGSNPRVGSFTPFPSKHSARNEGVRGSNPRVGSFSSPFLLFSRAAAGGEPVELDLRWSRSAQRSSQPHSARSRRAEPGSRRASHEGRFPSAVHRRIRDNRPRCFSGDRPSCSSSCSPVSSWSVPERRRRSRARRRSAS
jgi:hypothetical protein